MQLRKLRIAFALGCGIALLYATSCLSAEPNILQAMEREFQTIVNAVTPAVVEVVATDEVNAFRFRPTGRNAPSGASFATRHRQNIGSGIVIDSDGHIVTTGAVVANADSIEVKFASGQRQSATLLGVDAHSDIAVLRVEKNYPTKTALGDSDQLRAGSWVVTVGCSFGACPTLSFGIVNGLEILSDNAPYEAIQINTSVKPGNSGGAVANTSGQIVGVITAALAQAPLPLKNRSAHEPHRSGGILMGQGISFAIPIKTVQTIASHIIEHGEVARGWLGVWVDELDAKGVRVLRVQAKSPAEDAGILRRDIIVDFNGTPVGTYADLMKLVTSLTPKTPVRVKVLRGNERLALDVVLGAKN